MLFKAFPDNGVLGFRYERIALLPRHRREPWAFLSDRKAERFKAEFQGTLPALTETKEEWLANVRFLAALVVAMTNRARFYLQGPCRNVRFRTFDS